MKAIVKLGLFLGLLLISFSALAANQQCTHLKFGFINTVRLYTETKQAKEITAQLQKEFAPRRQQLDQMAAEGVNLQKTLQETDLSASKKVSLEKKLADLKQRYRQAQIQFSEDYALRRNEEFAALQRVANQVIAHIKQEDGYDWITDNAVIVDKKFDITDKIIQEMDNLQMNK